MLSITRIVKRIKEIQNEMTLLKVKPYGKIKKQRHLLLQEESGLKDQLMKM